MNAIFFISNSAFSFPFGSSANPFSMLTLTFKLYPQFASSPTALIYSTSFRMEVCKVFNFLYTVILQVYPVWHWNELRPLLANLPRPTLDRFAITAAFLPKKGHQIELVPGSPRVQLKTNCSPLNTFAFVAPSALKMHRSCAGFNTIF